MQIEYRKRRAIAKIRRLKNANAFQFMSALNFHFLGQCGGFNYVYYVCRNDCTHCRRNG